MRILLSLALCFALMVPCVAAPGSQLHPSKTALFDFHSGFWLNLHHFLYRQAVVAGPQKGPRQLSLNSSDIEELKLLSPDEKTAWDSAVAYYQDSLIQRDLLFDEGMRLIKNELENAETSVDLAGTQMPNDLKALLLKVAPIYRKHWWPKHDAQNRQWIRDLQPLIDKYGEGIANALAKIYEVPWPAPRVDAVAYGNWAGAYTTVEPTRVTISTGDSAIQGTAALEVVFHESSHGMIRKVEEALKTAEEAVNAKREKTFSFRRDLWHEVLFYTSGELVAERIPGYVPYPDKNGLWTRAWSMSDRKLIEQDWKPHMNGTVGLEPVLRKLSEDLAAQP